MSHRSPVLPFQRSVEDGFAIDLTLQPTTEIPESSKNIKKNRFSRPVEAQDELLRFRLEVKVYETAMIINVDASQHHLDSIAIQKCTIWKSPRFVGTLGADLVASSGTRPAGRIIATHRDRSMELRPLF